MKRFLPSSLVLVAVGVLNLGAILPAQVGAGRKSLPPEVQARLDQHIEALESEDEVHHIFVRMKDQVIPTAAAFATFCAENRSTPRRKLRQTVIADLKRRSDASWKSIEGLVRKMGGTLETDGDREEEEEAEEADAADQVDEVRRYWLVNGFACTATFTACLKLAAHPGVEFLYKNQLPFILPPAHNQPHSVEGKRFGRLYQQLAGNRDEVMADVLAKWDASRKAEAKPFDATGLEIPWNLRQTGADKVWSEEKFTGKGVTVAVMDTGCMPTTALVQALWRNPKEKFDGEDTDHNGYVDDVFGYDFMFRNGVSVGELRPAQSHGSLCAGIVAGRPFQISAGRSIVTGVAPRSQLMILRSLGHLPSYEYLLENGADVVSMSFSYADMELGNWRGVYRAAFQHLSAAGVVLVGSAGNKGPGKKTSRRDRKATPTGRQIGMPADSPAVIVVGGVEKNDSISPASSRGPVYWDKVALFGDHPENKPLQKPDLVSYFGGFPCWMYVVQGMKARHDNYEVLYQFPDASGLVTGPQGTSFSGPHVAGVAALMLEANPDLPAWRVQEILIATAKDLGAKGWDPDFGQGLVQALPAVRAAKKAR